MSAKPFSDQFWEEKHGKEVLDNINEGNQRRTPRKFCDGNWQDLILLSESAEVSYLNRMTVCEALADLLQDR